MRLDKDAHSAKQRHISTVVYLTWVRLLEKLRNLKEYHRAGLVIVKHIAVTIGALDACAWTQAQVVRNDSLGEVYTTLCGRPLYGSNYILILVLLNL
jgi:hypothetical protein